MDNQRNLILAVVLSGLLILGWQVSMDYFYPQPLVDPAEQEESGTAQSGEGSTGTKSGGAASDGVVGANAPTGPVDLDEALSSGNRIAIDAPRVAGSINLVGARVDDLVLKDYKATTEKDSGPVRLFSPAGTQEQHYAEFSFVVDGKLLDSSAVWQADGEALTLDNPVTLSRTDDNGITYSVRFSVDENYMIRVDQTANNAGEAAAIIQPFATIKRTDKTEKSDQFIQHIGPVGVFGGTLEDPHSFDELAELNSWKPEGEASWLGFSDSYWLSALIPGDVETDSVGFRPVGGVFNAFLFYDNATVPAGDSVSHQTQLFAGAKESLILDQYEDSGITYFGKAISWGWFEWFEKPLLWLLRTLNGLVGNFGVAIILLTLIVRGLMFPIAQKQFASMAAMKAVQPKMKAIQERYKEDKQVQQQKVAEMFKEEGVNPLAGCLPLIIQIPIFFALYKVLILAIEMRHEPFLYIADLAAPDPANLANLVGLIGINIPSFLMIIFGLGLLAVLFGISMWLTFKLNPSTGMDPVQQQVFSFMPWILMFVMSGFAAGLLLYWVSSNLLTLAQQKYLYSKHPQLRAAAEKEKAEKAQEKAREEAQKGEA